MYFLSCFFFFQAEDGIRDRNVTGVQTCALPILDRKARKGTAPSDHAPVIVDLDQAPDGDIGPVVPPPSARPAPPRSEERRVGKECRSRRAPEYDKKKE